MINTNTHNLQKLYEIYDHLEGNLEKIYQKARKYVQVKSGLDTFPHDCPYTLQQLLDEDWLPKK